MAVKLHAQIDCDHWESGEQCEVKANVLATITTAEDRGGDVVVGIDPELPEGWRWRYGSLKCPKHAD